MVDLVVLSRIPGLGERLLQILADGYSFSYIVEMCAGQVDEERPQVLVIRVFGGSAHYITI